MFLRGFFLPFLFGVVCGDIRYCARTYRVCVFACVLRLGWLVDRLSYHIMRGVIL